MKASDSGGMKAGVTVRRSAISSLILSAQVILPSLVSCPLYKHQIQLCPPFLEDFIFFFPLVSFFLLCRTSFFFPSFFSELLPLFHLTQGKCELRGAQEEHLPHLSAHTKTHTHTPNKTHNAHTHTQTHAHIFALQLLRFPRRGKSTDTRSSTLISSGWNITDDRRSSGSAKRRNPCTARCTGMKKAGTHGGQTIIHGRILLRSRGEIPVPYFILKCHLHKITYSKKKKKKRETGCGSPWICATAPPCGAVERRAGGWPPGSPLKRTVGRISFPQRVCLDGAAAAPSENAGGM